MITPKVKLITIYFFLLFTILLCILYFIKKIDFNPWLPTTIALISAIYQTNICIKLKNTKNNDRNF